MLTIFTVPKRFSGHFELIQRNAIRSWMQLSPSCQVILCGNEQGVADVAAELGILHIPDLECSEFGTPLLNSAVEQAQSAAHHDTMCYINCDIILLSDLLPALSCVHFPRYLVVGQRTDVEITAPIDFSRASWEHEIRSLSTNAGILQQPDHIDYFIFPRHAFRDIPAFVIGRTWFDNWWIFHARSLGYPVIDATPSVMAVHQNHNYNHIQGGKEAAYYGPEAERNRDLMGGKPHRFYITDATYKIVPPGKLARATDVPYLERRASRTSVLRKRSGRVSRFVHRLIGWIGRNRQRFPLWLWRLLIDRLAP